MSSSCGYTQTTRCDIFRLDPHVTRGAIVDLVSENAKLTVGAVAKLVGVSVRTLHHYDDIGLVVPSDRTSVGYRTYSAADIERLHQVLTYRELGFSLAQVQEIVGADSVDAMAHLRRQRELLDERIDRLHQMAAAVEKMMEAKSMGVQLTPQEQREIFGDKWLGDDYAADAEERWGESEQWKQSQQRTAQFSKADWQKIKDDGDAFTAKLAQAMADGVEPGSTEANALAEEHRAGIAAFYDCDHAMQVKVAETYLSDERMRGYYDGVAPGLAQYVRDIVVANAEQV
ncbi:MerR family transcriptional regulator [Antrihabitans cavernicola]|uniref:MerR family transcriptional regulator n=1 Tax=Antrihabitans cavernicola TaxID=2495913 RepID=A0A5A7SGQ0_9NOCA|nr:MerR family transcriptional regulator [Spelaeibacter cavernicola]